MWAVDEENKEQTHLQAVEGHLTCGRKGLPLQERESRVRVEVRSFPSSNPLCDPPPPPI